MIKFGLQWQKYCMMCGIWTMIYACKVTFDNSIRYPNLKVCNWYLHRKHEAFLHYCISQRLTMFLKFEPFFFAVIYLLKIWSPLSFENFTLKLLTLKLMGKFLFHFNVLLIYVKILIYSTFSTLQFYLHEQWKFWYKGSTYLKLASFFVWTRRLFHLKISTNST